MRLLPSPQHLSLLKGYYKTAAKGENKISQMKIEQKEPDAKKTTYYFRRSSVVK